MKIEELRWYHEEDNVMHKYDIDGNVITTNVCAREFPMGDTNWNSCTGFSHESVPFRMDKFDWFKKLVEEGYTRIRFVKYSTAVRGFYHVGTVSKK